MHLLHLVWREFHDQTRTHRFMGLTALALFLTPLVLYAGVVDYTTRLEQFDLLVASAATTGLVGRQIEPSLRLLRPPSPSSVFVRGVDGRLPKFWDFGPDGVHRGASPASAGRTPESGISLDLEFLIRIVLGLLAISLATGSFALERETGVFFVLRSQAVSSSALLFAKLIGGSLALGMALAVVTSGAAAALGAFEPGLWSPALRTILFGLGLAGLVYLAGLYAIGLIIGSLARSSSAANVTAMMTWIVIAAASVPTIEFLDQIVAPVPPAEITEARRLFDYETQRRQAENRLGQIYLEAVGPDWRFASLSAAGLDRIKHAWDQEAIQIRQHVQASEAEEAKTAARQRRLWNVLSRCTPGTLLFETASRIASTGAPTADRWEAAADDYQRLLNRALFDDPPRLTVRVPAGSIVGLVQVTFRANPDSSTFLAGSQPGIGARTGLQDATGPLVLSTVYLAGFVLITFIVFRRACRYDPVSS